MFNEYLLLANQYVLHADGEPVGRPTANLSIAFDRKRGTLFKHGQPAMVQTWAVLTLKRLVAAGHFDISDELAVVTGQLPLVEVNRCLQEPGYASEFFERLMAGEFNCAQVA